MRTSGPSAVEIPGSTAPSPAALRARQLLVVALALVSGATDAIGLMALGGAFTSVMTGNMVLLGVAASSADGALAASSGFAVLAFCAGAALGARIAGSARDGDPVWPRAVTAGLAVELAFFAVYAAGWWATGGDPGRGVALPLLLCTALGLGVQSATVQRFGISGMSTTYLTGTLTTVVMRLASGRVRGIRSSLEILLGLVAGAAAGALLVLTAPLAAPVLQLVLLGGVVVAGLRFPRR